MQPLNLKFDHNGIRVAEERVTAHLTLLAQAILEATGGVIDISQDAYRYDSHFVFRLTVTGLRYTTLVAFSNTTEPLDHEEFSVLVQDCVDALKFMEALRTQLRLQSLPLLCQASTVLPVGSARAMALSDVIRWHRSQIAHFIVEKARMKQWSEENNGQHPGNAYEEYESRIDYHNHLIARIVEISC
jgi:hypothetical protein